MWLAWYSVDVKRDFSSRSIARPWQRGVPFVSPDVARGFMSYGPPEEDVAPREARCFSADGARTVHWRVSRAVVRRPSGEDDGMGGRDSPRGRGGHYSARPSAAF
jgi:hypothetical protein